MFADRNRVLPRSLCWRLLQTPSEHQNQHTYVNLLYHPKEKNKNKIEAGRRNTKNKHKSKHIAKPPRIIKTKRENKHKHNSETTHKKQQQQQNTQHK